MTATAVAVAIVLCRLTPCWGMDAMTQSEMNDLCGRTGLNIAICRTVTVSAAFRSLNHGDPDGWGRTTTASVGAPTRSGFLTLIGTGANTGTLAISIPTGAVMTFDVARTGSCTYYPQTSSMPGFAIPPSTPFFTYSLTAVSISLNDPTTVNVYLNELAHQNPANDRVGYIKETGLAIDKANMTSSMYIWKHD